MPNLTQDQLDAILRDAVRDAKSWYARRLNEFILPQPPLHAYGVGYREGFKKACEVLRNQK